MAAARYNPNEPIWVISNAFSAERCALIVGIWGAIYLAQRIKRVLFGYEPEEIARMLQERDVILNSVREGIININSNGCITLVNSEAQLLLKQAGIEGVNELFGKSAKDVLKRVPLDDIIKEGKTLVDASVKMGNTVFIITAVPLLDGKNIIGAVITFRKKSVVEEMANQLTGFKNYATTTVMRNRSYVLNHCNIKTCCLKCSDCSFSTCTWALNVNFYCLHSMFHSCLSCCFCSCLSSERCALS